MIASVAVRSDGRRLAAGRADERKWKPELLSVRQQQHLGDRKRLAMRDGDERPRDPEPRRMPGCGAVQLQLRGAAAPHDLDVPPKDTTRVARAERLHRRFLRRPAAGEVRRWEAASCAILDLAVRKHAPHEAVAVTPQHVVDPRELGGVETDAEYGHTAPPA